MALNKADMDGNIAFILNRQKPPVDINARYEELEAKKKLQESIERSR